MNEPTVEQKRIAMQEALRIVKEYQEDADDNNLEQQIYEAILEALKTAK